ncbi:MAG: hypothetical protein V1672_04205 [Candidatus Diapherotrites archaeon]
MNNIMKLFLVGIVLLSLIVSAYAEDDFLYVIEVSSEIDHFGWLTGGQPFVDGTAIVGGVPNAMHDLGFKVYAYDLLAAETPAGGGFAYKIFSRQPLGQEFRTFYTDFSRVDLYLESRGEYGANGDNVTIRIRKNSVDGEIIEEITQFVEASIEPFWISFNFDEQKTETNLKKYVIELVGENDHFAWKLGEPYENGQAIIKNHLENKDFAFRVYSGNDLETETIPINNKGHLIFSNSQIAQEFLSEKEGFSIIEILLKSENNFNLAGENLTLKLHENSLEGKILNEQTIFVEKTMENKWIEFILESVCGNGIIEEGEQCDSENLNGNTCKSRGYDTGTLKCSSTCTFDLSECKNIVPAPIPVFDDESEKPIWETLWTSSDLFIRSLIALFVLFIVIVIIHKSAKPKNTQIKNKQTKKK